MSQQLDDLSPDAARILRIWRRSRPHAVMALRKSGKLRERLEAVAAALETGREMYLPAGLDPQSAEFEAMKDQGLPPRRLGPEHAGGVGPGDSRLGPATTVTRSTTSRLSAYNLLRTALHTESAPSQKPLTYPSLNES